MMEIVSFADGVNYEYSWDDVAVPLSAAEWRQPNVQTVYSGSALYFSRKIFWLILTPNRWHYCPSMRIIGGSKKKRV